jgi:hypothetical protein
MLWPDEPLPLEGLLDEPVFGPPPVESLDRDGDGEPLPLLSVPGVVVELLGPEPLVPEPLVPEPLVPEPLVPEPLVPVPLVPVPEPPVVPGAPLSPSPAPVPFVPV